MLADLRARIQQFADRPVPDGDRRRVAAVYIVVVIAIAALLVALRAQPAPERTRAPAPPVAAPAPPPASTAPTPAPTPGITRAEIRDATRAARRFLRTYLPFTYGQVPASRITAVHLKLRELLAASPPRVAAAERHRHAHVQVLQPEEDSAAGVLQMLALVKDEARTYSLRLSVQRVGGAWVVTKVGV